MRSFLAYQTFIALVVFGFENFMTFPIEMLSIVVNISVTLRDVSIKLKRIALKESEF